jgi:hypothetical protein
MIIDQSYDINEDILLNNDTNGYEDIITYRSLLCRNSNRMTNAVVDFSLRYSRYIATQRYVSLKL